MATPSSSAASGVDELALRSGRPIHEPPRLAGVARGLRDRVVRAGTDLLEDGALLGRFGAAGRRIAVEEFALDRVIRETLEVYAELSASRPAPVSETAKVST